MSSPTTTATVRLTGSAGLLSALPTLLGYHPSDDLVIACLSRRGVIAPVMRIGRADFTPQMAVHLTEQAATFADRVAVVSYSQDPASDEVAAIMAGYLFGAGVEIVDTLTVSNDPAKVNEQLQGLHALTGRRMLNSRAEVAASIEYAPLSEVDPAVAALVEQAETGTHPHEIVAAILADPAPTVEAVAVLLPAVRQLPDHAPATAVLCTALCVLAYVVGDGALANLAVERALRTVPGYDPARTIDALMIRGETPEFIRAAYR